MPTTIGYEFGDVSFRLGLNSGEVIVSKIGDDLVMNYTAQVQVGLAQRMKPAEAEMKGRPPGDNGARVAPMRCLAAGLDLHATREPQRRL